MTGLFLGRSNFDVGFVCPAFPSEDTKLEARETYQCSGGPALNAAVAFAALGGAAHLVSAIGADVLSDAVRRELDDFGVSYSDAARQQANILPISSIIVNAANGSRTIVSDSAVNDVVLSPDDLVPPVDLTSFKVALWDGHLPSLCMPLLDQLREADVPLVMDCGGWKSWMSEVRFGQTAIVSERFSPPHISADDLDARFDWLFHQGAQNAAITRGGRSILWRTADGASGEIDPPEIEVVDTLGAGDIFHGAFCFYHARGQRFSTALESAAKISALACSFVGPRKWIDELEGEEH